MSRRAAFSGPASFIAVVLAAVAGVASLPAGCARGVPCEFNSDCAIGYCDDGACRKDCVDAARDCPGGFVCNDNAQCVPGSSSSSSGTGGTGGATTTSSSSSGAGGTMTSSSSSSSSSSGAGGTGGTTSTSSSSSSSSSTSSSTGNPATKHEFDLCGSDTDCASPLVCRPKVTGGAKRCTRTCSASAQCMTGTRCELFGNEQYCGASDVGRVCTTATNPCNFACLNDQYCTSACNTGADCPNGYGCMDISPYRVCVKAEAPCSSADTSLCAIDYCDESPEMYVGGCTLPCNTASDCPQRASVLEPWVCSGGGCFRPSDVFGPLEGGSTPAQYVNDCQGQVVNVCNDGFHIDYNAFSFPNPPAAACGATTTTSGIPTDSCLNSCRYQGGCTYGFACTGVGNLGTARIGLCLPAGGGEIGAACAHDSQCIFGYCNQNKCSRDCTYDGICPAGTTCVAGGSPAVEGQPFRRCQ